MNKKVCSEKKTVKHNRKNTFYLSISGTHREEKTLHFENLVLLNEKRTQCP